MTEAIGDPRAWTASTVAGAAAWYVTLPAECLAIMRAKAGQAPRDGRPVTDLRLTPAERATCRRSLTGVLHALEHDRGFAIVRGVPAGPDSADEARAVYWLIGQALGEPCEQNVQGTLLYDVRNTGASLSEGARFSVTNYESSFHTDNSFGDGLADYVGLLCLQVARSGGVNYLVSGLAVHRIMREEYPEALAVLCEPFHVDRRGGTRGGEAPTALYPVIAAGEDGPVYRYLRYWIEAGHQKAGVPLTAEQVAALDTLDRVLGRPDLRAEFALKAGEALWINNRWLLHNRTAFVDFEEPHRRRHLVRLWVRRDGGS
jgi:alpha-ketoglutarate-dependent taurine dioxygenase